jgi:hypothetical protein
MKSMLGMNPLVVIEAVGAKSAAVCAAVALLLSIVLTTDAWTQPQPPAGMPSGPPPGMPPGMPGPNGAVAEAHFIAAIQVKDGVYLPEKSARGSVSGNNVGNTSASGIEIKSKADKFNGIYVHGGKSIYTVSDAKIELSGKGLSDFEGVAAGALVSSGAALVLKNVRIATNGVVSTTVTATGHSTLKVYDSTLIANGGPLPSGYVPKIGPGMMEPPSPLRITGDARATLTMMDSKSFFYNSTIIAEGWGAVSTDAAHGVYVEANNCDIRTIKSGYGTYADGGATVAINGSTMNTATYGGVIAGTGIIYLNNDKIVSGSNAVMIHDVMGSTTEVGVLKIKGGNIATRDATIFVKSANADITIEHAKLASQNGDLILSVVNDDPNATRVGNQKPVGTKVMLKDENLEGNILHLDPARTMSVAFRNTSLKGEIEGVALSLDAGSRWTATANSHVVLIGSIDVKKIDAPAGITIVAVAGDASTPKGTYKLASGGVLTIKAK